MSNRLPDGRVRYYIKEVTNCLQCPYHQTVMKAPAKRETIKESVFK